MNKIKIFSLIIFLSLFLISCGNNKEVISENNNVVNRTEEKIILAL
jgi:PBP1b-binding outer membrane lipoprotein LpoB